MFFCEPIPWRIPVPFVGPALRTMAALILLANVNALYDKMVIFGVKICLPIYVTNLGLIGAIFLALCIFAALKQQDFAIDRETLTATITVSILWTITACFNTAILIVAFVKCHSNRFRTDEELRYCHFFGNAPLARAHGFAGKSWPLYYWVSVVSALVMAFWQMLNWLNWIREVRRVILFNRRPPHIHLNDWPYVPPGQML
ncbi:hypothetical protein V8C34DRAFT_5283 [Trichoderma compactum]